MLVVIAVRRSVHKRYTIRAVTSTPFAWVTSLAAGVTAATSLLDLFTGEANISPWWTALVTVLAVTITALPMLLGEHFPPPVALIGCALFAVITIVQTAQSDTVIMAVNNLVLYPMVSCYLGWFFPSWLARSGVAVLFVGSAGAILMTGHPGLLTTWANLALASLFCLEAALFLRAKLDRQIETDPLTGAFNRVGLRRRLQHDLARAASTGAPLTVAVLDLDEFKAVNDRFGHAVGDQTLINVVEQLRDSIREHDTIARMGGDEFVLTLPNTPLPRAQQILQRLAQEAAAPWTYGITEARSSDTETSVIVRADQDLYTQKHRRGDAASTIA